MMTLQRLSISILSMILFSMAGCATVSGTMHSARLAILPGTPFEQGKYDEHLAYLVGPHGPFASDAKRRAALNDLFDEYKRNKYFISSTTFLQRRYEYAYSLIECGQHAKAINVCIEGLNECKILHDFVVKNRPKKFAEAVSKALVEAAVDDADESLFREQMGKLKQLASYAVWFGTGDVAKARNFFEESIENIPRQRLVPYHITRAAFYQKILGDNTIALREIDTALKMTDAMALMKSDLKNEYLIKAYLRQTDLFLKFGYLQKALENMEKQQAEKEGVVFSARDYVVGNMAAFRGTFSTAYSLAGGVYASLREFDKAKKQFDKSWEYIKDVKDSNNSDRLALAAYYVMYGAYYLGQQGKYGEAVKFVEKGISYLRPTYIESIENVVDIESAYLFAAELNYRNRDKIKAMTQALKSYEESKRYRNKVTAGAALILLGKINYEEGRLEKAKEHYEGAMKLVGDTENTENWKLFYGLGQIYEKTGNTGRALSYYKKAVEEVEKLWQGRFKDSQKQVSFIDNRMVVFDPVIRLLTDQGKADEVVSYIERSKARAFFETSLFTQREIMVATVSPDKPHNNEANKLDDEMKDVTEKIASLKARIAEIENILNPKKSSTKTVRGVKVKTAKPGYSTTPPATNLSKKERATLKAEQGDCKKSAADLEKRLNGLVKNQEAMNKRAVTDTASIGELRPLTADNIRKMLDKNTAVIDYFVGGKAVIGVIITTAGTSAKILPQDASWLKRNIHDYRKRIESVLDSESVSEYEDQGLALYEALVKPFEDRLGGIRRLCIIPQGVLHYLPFHALIAGKRTGVPLPLLARERELVGHLALLAFQTDSASGRGIKSRTIPAKPVAPVVSTASVAPVVKAPSVAPVAPAAAVIPAATVLEGKEKTLADLKVVRAEIAKHGSAKSSAPGPNFLIKKYEISYGPSATIINHVKRRSNRTSGDNLLALGSPPAVDVSDLALPVKQLPKLEDAKIEVQRVGELFTDKAIFTDDAATLSIARAYAPKSGVILFAAHGLLNRRDPLKSSIFLNKDATNNGRLTVEEVERMNLNARLVVLSACESALLSGYEGVSEEVEDMKFPYGDDLVGLQRGFIKAGASSVLSTLWSVYGDSTAQLSFLFFEKYRKYGEKAKAMREAEMRLIEDGQWAHPYFWAPFVLSGDWI